MRRSARLRFTALILGTSLLCACDGERLHDAPATHASETNEAGMGADGGQDATPDAPEPGEDAALGANDAGDQARDAAGEQADARAADVEMGPCDGSADSKLVYNLCLWASPDDLARLEIEPEARLEVPAEVSLSGRRYQSVELELHGGTARGWKKKSYRVRFADERPKFDFFGDGKEKQERLVLQAAWIDQTFVRAKLVMDLMRELGGYAPRVSYARVFINGEFAGLYQTIERIDEHYLDEHGFARTGNLYKAEDHAANWDVHENPLAGFSERTNEDGKADDLAQLFSACKNSEATHEAFERELAPLLSLEDFLLWHLVMSYTLNLDTYTKNYYLYHDPQAASAEQGAVFRVIHWDADTSFGQYWDGQRFSEPGASWLYGDINKCAGRLFGITQYRKPYLERYAQLLETHFSTERVLGRARALLDALEPEIAADRERWQREGLFADERAYLEETIMLRHQVMSRAVAEAQ
jgi:hypothetical protein